MMLGDKLPRFRADLKVEPKTGTKGLFEVTDPVAAKHFTLYDFELSMARMMNGQRTAQQVMQQSTQLAIPVTLDSLEKFVRQLRAYGFVEDPLAEPAGTGSKAETRTWAEREEWDPALRELFRSALVKLRQNRLAEAREYLDAMLGVDQGNKEALEVLAEIAEREKNPPPEPVPLSARVDAMKKLPKWMFGAAGGVVVLLLLVIPFPRTLPAQVTFEAGSSVSVTAAREVVVKEAVVQEGKWVDSGAALVQLDTSEREAGLKKLEGELADSSNKLAIAQKLAKKKGAKPAVVARAKELQAKVDQGRAALQKLRSDSGSWVISAPASGLVAKLDARPGVKLGAGQVVAQIEDPRKLKVVAAVDARAAAALEPGQKVAATVKGHALELPVVSVDGARAVCALANDDRVFGPGDTGTATIKVSAKSLLGRLFR